MTSTTPLLIGGLGGPELLIILAVLLLLFGASKLPELARGGGQALRIFKAETKGLTDSDDTTPAPVATAPVEPTVAPVSEPVIVETPRTHDAPRS
jgi:sec-independent protein translocase protein TatA